MKAIREIRFYLLLGILIVSGGVSLFILPSEISRTIVASIIALGIFVGFCFILLLINGFIKHTTVPGGRTFMRDRYGRFEPVRKMYKK